MLMPRAHLVAGKIFISTAVKNPKVPTIHFKTIVNVSIPNENFVHRVHTVAPWHSIE